MSGIKPEPNVETIAGLPYNDVADNNKANKTAEPENKKNWRRNINISPQYNRYRQQVEEVLDLFADKWDGHLGNIKATIHRIEFKPNSKPIFQQPYGAVPKLRQLEKDEIDKMLREGIIEPACCEWGSPIIFAPKKDRTLRLFIDYRKLKAITVKDV